MMANNNGNGNVDVFTAIEHMVQQNPNMLDTPFKRAMYQAVQERDSKKGEELMQNFCSSMGVSPEMAFNAAGNYMQGLVQNGPPQQMQRR